MDNLPPQLLHSVVELHQLVARNDTSSTTTNPVRPPVYKVVGLSLAIASGLLIGSSFVLKKIGLLKANEKYNEEAGEGYGYLKNAYWWSGMTLMILGEICNFVAYAFVDAILVTPLGALSVVVTTILSAIFLKERLSFVGKIGCFNCIVGSVVIVLNAPEQSAVADIQQMKGYVIAPGFLSYAGVIIVGSAFIALWVGPRYGKKSMLVYLSVCSLIGGLSVVATQGLGSAIVAQAGGKPQFNQWFLYVLLVFVITTLVTEIIYLNKALNLFNAALVTPTYYVFFTSATIVTSSVLFRGFKGTPISIATVIMGFLQICAGVVLLQLSKSAKDVPDAAVFKGDLDQVREVAEQEQPETEPKADAIRGAAAIVRRISTARLRMEEREFRRLHEEKQQEHLEPLKENEIAEWDGLRRRKTVIGESSPASPIVRRRTIHPPLGMSHFPAEHDQEDNTGHDENQGHFFDNFRSRASSVFRPFTPRHHDQLDQQSPMHPVALTDIEIQPSKVDTSYRPYGSGSGDGQAEYVYGAASGSRKTSRLKSVPSPRSKPLPDKPAPSPRSTLDVGSSGARRQFSFTNFLRSPRTPAHDHEDLPPVPSRIDIASRGSSYSHEQKKAMKNATEEERLGLVKGDSHHALLRHDSSPERPLYPIKSGSPTQFPSSYNNSSTGYLNVDDDDHHQPVPSRGHRDATPDDDTYSDSDGDDGWQMTSPPNASPPSHPIATMTTTPQEIPRPGSRKRPSPPPNYRQQQSQWPVPSIRAVKRKSIPIPPREQQTPFDSRRPIVEEVEQTNPTPVAGRYDHSRTLSTNRSRSTTQYSRDPVQAQEQGRNRDQRSINNSRREEFGEQLEQTTSPEDIDLDRNQREHVSSGSGGEGSNSNTDTKKKHYEAQSAREREHRRQRMSWSANNSLPGVNNNSSNRTQGGPS